MFGFGTAGAQPYYGSYGYYGPAYYGAPPPPPPHYYYAHPYYHHYYHHYYRAHYYYAGCAYRRHRAGAIGAVAGGIGGGIIGAAITHGNPAFAMIGAGAGALTGNAIGRNSHPYPC
jgi:hypothetical protein